MKDYSLLYEAIFACLLAIVIFICGLIKRRYERNSRNHH
jgi:hypothetical protein